MIISSVCIFFSFLFLFKKKIIQGDFLVRLFSITACICAYCSGYGKMPEYEHIFTDFLLSLVQSNYKKRNLSGKS